MKTEQIIFISPQGWFQIANRESREIKPWSDLKGPALVVVDFSESQVGLQACQGRPEYAAAQIEKQVRAGGGVDGPLHVFVHRQNTLADSSLALYTAVSLERWQAFQTWSSRQADHCMVIPVAALLTGAVTGNELLILRVGSQLHGFSASASRMHYAGVAALGQQARDFQAPLRTLINQLRLSGWKGAAREVRWANVFCDSLDAERALVGELSDGDLIDAKLVPHDALRSHQGTGGATALPHLLDTTGAGAIQAPWLPRLAWLSEAYVMPLAAMLAVVAIGLGAFAFFAQNQVVTQLQAAQAVEGEIETLRERVAAVTPSEAAAKMAPASVAFVKELGFSAVHDPVRMLSTVRQAADGNVRVQRLQLIKASSSAKNPYFRVDGVALGGSNDSLRRFLSALRVQGWQAESAPTNDGALGAFAYDLKPVSAGQAS
jgi:hypothetical protein